jgi:DNA-binding SARP family transcriptional activator
MTRRRGPAVAVGLAALLTLLAVVGGLPVLLYWLGGSPIPGHVAPLGQLGHALLHRESSNFVLAAVRDVSWIAWALFTLGVLAEVQAILRRRTPPRLWLGGLQSAAGRLVALAALTFTTAPIGTLLATPQPAVAAVAAVPSGQAELAADFTVARAGSQGMSMGFFQLVTVRPGDCLWTIAQHYLGNGDRYQEIVTLNLGHDMSQHQVFRDPSVIQPGWVLHLPASAAPHATVGPDGGSQGSTDTHDGHPASSHPQYRHAHAAASAAPSGTGASAPSGQGVVAGGGSGGPTRPAAPVGPASGGSEVTTLTPAQESQFPVFAAFGTGVLAGGAAVSLSRLRHRQRQTRRPGRRIPLPASAPVAEAEQRLKIAAVQEPVTGLRGVLHYLASALVGTGQQIPEIAGLSVQPDVLEVLLARPAIEPPSAPFTVPGGRQGMAWRLRLDDELDDIPGEAGDLLPGLLSVGTADGGYLLIDLEHLQVTTVTGPASMTAAMLRSAAAELATGQLAGWYDLILVGFPELSVLGGRGTCCDSLDAGLDLLAAKAVALRRRLGDAPLADVRYHRLIDPADEDWALALLVSALPPTAGQLALLSDLAADPAGIAALVPGGVEPSSGHRQPAEVELSAGPPRAGTLTARISPLQLESQVQSLDDADYEALTTLFATALEGYDVGAADPPYDNWVWPPDVISRRDDATAEWDDDAVDQAALDETGPHAACAGDLNADATATPASAANGPAPDRISELAWAADAPWTGGRARADDQAPSNEERPDEVDDTEDPDWASEPVLVGETSWAAAPSWTAVADPATDPSWTAVADSAADPAWSDPATDPGRSDPAWSDSAWSDPPEASDPAWSDPSWSDPPEGNDPARSDPAWSDASHASDPAWGSDPAWTADPASSADSASRPGPDWTTGPAAAASPTSITQPNRSPDLNQASIGEPDGAADPGAAAYPADSTWAGDEGWPSDRGWPADAAVTGLPGKPAAWLQEPDSGTPSALPPRRGKHGRDPVAPAAIPVAPAADPAAPAAAAERGTGQQNLRIGVLGTFTINGQPGALLPAQSQLVLALALNGSSGLSNQQLCYLLGADPDRPKPTDSLRQLIVRTRRQLGRAPDRAEWIQHLGGGQYALHPAARFDWTEFEALTADGMRARDAERLRQALGLIRGRPFTGCYYWWLDLALTETVRAQIVDAADVLAALEIAAGHPAAAAKAARIGLAGDAGAEQLWRALMRAEHAAGNLSGVREAWNRCLDVIAEIAPDGEPHPGTAALYRELLGGSPARAAWAGG